MEYDTGPAGIIRERMHVVRYRQDGQLGYTIKVQAAGTNINTTFGTGTPGVNFGGNSSWRVFFLNDGVVIVMPYTQGCKMDATGKSNCLGFIDVNGKKGPNKQVTCTRGSGDTCEVDNPTDVYPVWLGDATVLPATDAAKAVLNGK